MDGEIEERWLFHTDGPNCHWCASGVTIYVWGPYGTNICAHCEELIEAGREWEVAETVAAAITVRDNWHGLDPEKWRQREHALIARWLEVRIDRTEVPAGKPHCESERLINDVTVVGCALINGHDGAHQAELLDDDGAVSELVEWEDAS